MVTLPEHKDIVCTCGKALGDESSDCLNHKVFNGPWADMAWMLVPEYLKELSERPHPIARFFAKEAKR